MAGLLARERLRLRHPEHAGCPVEPQPPETSWRRLARIGELSRKPKHTFVDHAAIQSCRLSGIGAVHAQWCQLRHLLHNRQSGAAPPAGPGESEERTILWLYAEDRYWRYGQL